MRCRKCHEEAQARWNAMTLEEQQAHHAANMEAAARYFKENDEMTSPQIKGEDHG